VTTTRALLLRIGLTLLPVWAAAAEREFKRTFPLAPGGSVTVDSYRGSITVEESDQPEVTVLLQMSLATDDPDEAERIFSTLELEAVAEDNRVVLRARNPRETRVRFVWNDKRQIDLDWRITVPRKCDVEMLTGRGSITAGNLGGRIVARTEIGSISLKRIDGSVEASTDLGDIVVSRCTGPTKIRVLRGLIRVGFIGGPADLRNTTGDVEVMSARGGVTAAAEAGDVYMGFPSGMASDSRITTAGGSIFVRIDPALNCTVDASSVWGRVENMLPMTLTSGADGKGRLTGQVGQGGPQIVLHANGGHVKIAPGGPYPDGGGTGELSGLSR
jgi:hypothetical protein